MGRSALCSPDDRSLPCSGCRPLNLTVHSGACYYICWNLLQVVLAAACCPTASTPLLEPAAGGAGSCMLPLCFYTSAGTFCRWCCQVQQVHAAPLLLHLCWNLLQVVLSGATGACCYITGTPLLEPAAGCAVRCSRCMLPHCSYTSAGTCCRWCCQVQEVHAAILLLNLCWNLLQMLLSGAAEAACTRSNVDWRISSMHFCLVPMQSSGS